MADTNIPTEKHIPKPSIWRMIFSRTLLMEITGWSFTWVLALLPVLFVLCKQHLMQGKFSFPLLCSTGELFLVSIVMVAEPLGGYRKK